MEPLSPPPEGRTEVLELSPSRNLLLRGVDAVLVTATEVTKSVLRESWGACGQLINWGAQTVVSFVVPGYRAASRARLDPPDVTDVRPSSPTRTLWPESRSSDTMTVRHSESASERAFRWRSDGKELYEKSEFSAHRGKPVAPLDRAAGGSLATEAKLAMLASVDLIALRLRRCSRATLQGRRPLSCCWRSRGGPSPPRNPPNGVSDSAAPQAPDVSNPCAPPAHEEPAAVVPPSVFQSHSTTQVLITQICGYDVEAHVVRTVDGYSLSLLRIPRVGSSRVALFQVRFGGGDVGRRVRGGSKTPHPTVPLPLQHGIIDTASAWVSTGSVYSLAARAYQRGYDVFLCNLRGTNDSLGANGISVGGRSTGPAGAGLQQQQPPSHTTASPASSEAQDEQQQQQQPLPPPPKDGPFWDFSVDDHALDVAAHVRFVRRLKRAERPQRLVLQAQLAAQQRAVEQAKQLWRARRGGGAGTATQSPRHVGDADGPLPSSPGGVSLSEGGSREGDAPELTPLEMPPSSCSIAAESSRQRVPSPDREAGDASIDDVRIVAVGHSSKSLVSEHAATELASSSPSSSPSAVGGCCLLIYLLVCAALRRPPGLSRVILLSPAGLHRHLPTPHKLFLLACYFGGVFSGSRPFPSRSPAMQRLVSLALQDLKMLHGTVSAACTG